MRGNTRDPEYRRIVQLYEFNKLLRWTRRGATPTDIDGRYYLHSDPKYHGGGRDAFFFLELKTEGTTTQQGQRDALIGLCRALGDRCCVLIAEHPPVHDVNVPDDITRFKLMMWDTVRASVSWTEWMEAPTDSQIGWWIDQWYKHVENDGPSHFITAFRQRASIYRTLRTSSWVDDYDAAGTV